MNIAIEVVKKTIEIVGEVYGMKHSTATCPNCTVLKSMLKKEAIEFSEVNMA